MQVLIPSARFSFSFYSCGPGVITLIIVFVVKSTPASFLTTVSAAAGFAGGVPVSLHCFTALLLFEQTFTVSSFTF